jgi:hypothetical protein
MEAWLVSGLPKHFMMAQDDPKVGNHLTLASRTHAERSEEDPVTLIFHESSQLHINIILKAPDARAELSRSGGDATCSLVEIYRST